MREYIAVTAARNEEELDKHVESVLGQSISPSVYVVVDDMSHPPIERSDCVVIRSNLPRIITRGVNQSASIMLGVKKASQLCPGWRYLLKLDADTIIPGNYSEKMIEFHQSYPNTGISSGVSNTMTWHQQKHRPSDAAKMFTRECWDRIGGYTIGNGFDTHATLKAIIYGYKPRINPDAVFTETRPNVKTGLARWSQSGKIRAEWGLPLWHTGLAAGKNLLDGRPLFLGPLTMILSHALYKVDESMFPRKWINNYARWELKNIVKRLVT